MRKSIVACILLVLAGCARVSHVSPPSVVPPAPSDTDSSIKVDITLERFNELWTLITEKYVLPIENTEDRRLVCFLQTVVGGVAACLDDSHSRYVSPKATIMMNESTSGSIGGGVGFQLSRNDMPVVIKGLISDAPAEQSGKFQVGDQIIEVGKEDVSQFSTDDVASKIRGEVGTQVIIRVRRGGKKLAPVMLMRGEVLVPSVMVHDLEAGLSYVRIMHFNHRTPTELLVAMGERLAYVLPTEEVVIDPTLSKFVIDLRGNPGGLVSSVGMISYLFSNNPGQLILTTKLRDGQEVLRVVNFFRNSLGLLPGMFQGVKVTVLIDGGSASAAEIFAQFLNEVSDAPRVGTRSYGKGSVQGAFPLSQGDTLLLTIGEYFVGNNLTPINKVGIQPEYEVEGTKDEISFNDLPDPIGDAQLRKAIEILRAL